jgi:hypothetical protein
LPKGSENVPATAKPSWTKPVPIALVLIAVAAFLAGALIVAVASHAFGPVRLDRQVIGVVTLVNADGSSLCLTEDSGGAEFCSDVLTRANASAPTLGQRVTGTIVWTPTTGGSAQGLLVTSGR